LPDQQKFDEYLAKAKWADEKAAGATSPELAEQWRNVANAYRQAASILQRIRGGATQ
jgi:hypothetical protein